MFVTTPFLALCDLQNKIVELNEQLNIYGTHWIGLIGRMVEFSDGTLKVTGQFMNILLTCVVGDKWLSHQSNSCKTDKIHKTATRNFNYMRH